MLHSPKGTAVHDLRDDTPDFLALTERGEMVLRRGVKAGDVRVRGTRRKAKEREEREERELLLLRAASMMCPALLAAMDHC